MMQRHNRKIIDLTENGEFQISRKDLPFRDEDKLSRALEDLNSIVTISRELDNDIYRIKADSRVGAVTVNGLRIQVRPRLSAGEFFILLIYAISGKIPQNILRSFSELNWGIGFENALGMLLSNEVNEIRRIGFSRRYEEKTEAMEVIRGRPLWDKNFPWRGRESKEICCRYHRLTHDNIDNQLLSAGLRRSWMLLDDDRTNTGLLHHLKVLSDLASERPPDISQFEKVKNGYNRLNEHYRVAHELSKMFLFSLRPRFVFTAGSHTIPGIVLDMAELFERFLERFMTDLLSPAGLEVRSQKNEYRALLDGEGRHYASVRPDLEIWDSRRLVGIVDAKYKTYWMAKNEALKPIRKIANEDLYQVFFYQQRLQHKYKLAAPPPTFIASPLPEYDERHAVPLISERYRRVIFQAGSEKAGEVQLILIPVTRFLRTLKEGVSLSEAVIQTRDEYFNEFLKSVNG